MQTLGFTPRMRNEHLIAYLSIEFHRFWDVPDHFRSREFLLHLSVFRNFKDTNLPRPGGCQRDQFGEMVGQIMDHAGLWEQERVYCFFSIMDSGPDHLEAPFSLELDNADIQFLVEYDGVCGVNVTRCHDLRDALIQRTFENTLG